MPTTFNVFYLGTAPEIDTVEGNVTSENHAALNGLTFGGPSNKIAFNLQSLSDDPTSHYSSGGNVPGYDADNASFNEKFSIDGGAPQVHDATMIYTGTVITYTDGTTAVVNATVMQDTTGNLYLLPPTTGPDAYSAALEAKPIESITLGTASPMSGSLVYGMTADRYLLTVSDYVVEGTSGDDLINAAYAGDPEGDFVDDTDFIDGTNNDSIRAEDGNDTVLADAGDDTVDGGAGDDRLEGGDGNDSLIGGLGADLILGNAGFDTLVGGDGNDTFISDGVDTVSLSYADIVADLSPVSSYRFEETAGGTTADSSGGNDGTVSAGVNLSATGVDGVSSAADFSGSNSTINFGGDASLNPVVGTYHLWVNPDSTSGYILDSSANTESEGMRIVASGGAVNVTLYDGGSNITLSSGGGALSAGSWSHIGVTWDGTTVRLYVDGVEVDNRASGFNVSGNSNDMVLGAKDDGGSFNNFFNGRMDEFAVHDTALSAADMATLASAGPAGGEVRTTGDVFSGDGGIDEVDYSASTQAVDVDLATGTGTGGAAEGDSYTDIENVTGSAFGDFIIGSTADNRIDAGAGDDTIEFGAGNNTVIAGDGNDYVDDAPGSPFYGGNNVVDLGAGNDTIFSGSGSDTVLGGDGADQIDGQWGNDSLSGGSGNDNIIGGDGADTLLGGLGDDSISGGAGNDFLKTGQGRDTLDGGDCDDTLMNSAGNDTLEGGTGNDTLYGGTGNDSLDGGADKDLLLGDMAGVEFNGTGTDGLGLASGITDFPTTQLGYEITFAASTFSATDTPLASYAVPGSPNEFYLWVDNAGNFKFEFGGTGTINTGVSATSYFDGSVQTVAITWDSATGDVSLFAGGTEVYSGTHNTGLVLQQGGTFVLGQEQDAVGGGFDPDQTFPGTIYGVRLYDDVRSPAEILDSVQGPIADTTDPNLVANWVADAEAASFTDLTGSHPMTMSGDVAATWSSGDDVLRGGAGADTLFGGGGQDTFFFEAGFGNDTVLGGREGTDDDTLDLATLSGAVTGTFSGAEAGTLTNGTNTVSFSEIENLVLTGQDDSIDAGSDTAGTNIIAGAGSDTILGGTGADSIQGEEGADLLKGGAGADTIRGGTSRDTLQGGAGDDVLTGGAGDDTFVYVAGDGNDTITDFNAGNTGTLTDLDNTNNDFIDLSAFYDDIWELYGDQADDGILNQSNATDINGNAVDYSDNTSMAGGSLTFTGASADPSFFTVENTGVVCFAAGTRILTPAGEIPIEHLRQGDAVTTRDNGPQRIVWIASHHPGPQDLAQRPQNRPVILAPKLTGADAPLVVSPQHGILLPRANGDEVLVRATHLARMRGGMARIARGRRSVTYFHMMFERHEIVFANRAPSESFYPGPHALGALAPPPRRRLGELVPISSASRPNRSTAARPGPLRMPDACRKNCAT